MPLELLRNDITKMNVDVIVNAANTSLLGGGGVDGAIHEAAGPDLLKACKALGECLVGEAKITQGYLLPAKYVIHTVGPVWQGGTHQEAQLLRNCYLNSLELAEQHHLQSIAFPLISTGAYGYPKDRALQIALSAIETFLQDHEMMVYLVSFDRESFELSEQLFVDIQSYIDDQYVEVAVKKARSTSVKRKPREPLRCLDNQEHKNVVYEYKTQRVKLIELVEQVDMTFSQSLLQLIDEKGLSDVETYKKANISRKLFSKIRSNDNYQPSKLTALAFAIALQLNFDETQKLLARAGFALSNSSKFDIIIQYFILQGRYDIHEINAALFKFDQRLLGQS